MWIEELANGKFKYVERYDDPLTGKTKKVSITHIKKNKRVEKEMFLKLQEKIDKKLSKSAIDINFEELTVKWLAVYEKQVKASTYNNNESYIKVINRQIGKIALETLAVGHLNNTILSFFDSGYAFDTVKNVVGTIRNVIKFGIEYGYLNDRELLHGISLPKINKREKDDLKYLERDELMKVVEQMSAAGYPEVGRMAQIQTYTGMRYGEMIGLDYDQHIDFEDKTITIERTWYHRRKVFNSPKNGKTRIIHFNQETEKIIREQINFSRQKVLKHNLDKKQRLLFINLQSEPFTNSYSNELLGRYVSIPDKHVTTHIFRHTFISLMVEQGVELSLIAKHVGHSNTNMIQKVYAHFTNKMNEDLKSAINDFTINF